MMQNSRKEKKDVLKLVHPQRRVEIHTQPITAAEIMKRNPRHCVARPDVFQHPWSVVKPESVLFPGKVFYIVPKRTIYCLLKAREQTKDQVKLVSKYSSHDHKPRHHNLKQVYASNLTPGNALNFKNQNPHREEAFQNKLWEGVSSDEEDLDHKQSYAKSRRSFEISKKEKFLEKGEGLRSRRHQRYSTSVVPTQNETPIRVIKCLKQENGLKSSLSKQKSVRKKLGLRVSFADPISKGDADSPGSSENCQAPPIKI